MSNNIESGIFLELKAGLLCLGIRQNSISDALYYFQNPADIGKSGLVGLHFTLGETGIPVLASTTYRFDKRSPFQLSGRGKKAFDLRSEQGLKLPITAIPMPSWYQETTSSGKKMHQVLAHEGTNFLHMQYSGCDLQRIKLGCGFCNTGARWNSPTSKEIAETTITAYKENPAYQLCLGGGTRLPFEENVDFFTKTTRLIRKRNGRIPIWVEMVPPATNEDIERMIDAGVTAFGFNLEVWSDLAREKLCPGKSQILKQRYLQAMQYVQKRLGPDCINTALIAGLEPTESTTLGINVLSTLGIEITLLPFRPWDNARLANSAPADPDTYLALSRLLAEQMGRNNIDPEKHYGCAKCPSCTLE